MAPTNNDGDDAVSTETLSSVFDHAFRLHSDIVDSAEDFRSERFQSRVKKCIMMLEDATRLVSLADVFSRNESIGEVPTEHVKFFLLPALLGSANGKLFEGDGPGPALDRSETIAVQEAYIRDFLQRCNDYEICDVSVPKEDDEDEGPEVPAAIGGRPPDLAKMNREREEKIRRYREQKLLEERVGELRSAVLDAPDRADEDAVREFYLKTISVFVNRSLDELASFTTEKQILRHMKSQPPPGRGAVVPAAAAEKRRPLKPIVITRDKLQKEVFGMGYKNLPVLSIEEFYEQRVRDGWFPGPQQQAAARQTGRSLQGMAEGADQRAAEEAEAAEKEGKEERDDEEELARKRAWDEYTDEHRRGEGNMHNKG